MKKATVDYFNLIDCSYTLRKLLPQTCIMGGNISSKKRKLRVLLVGSLGFIAYYIIPLFITILEGVFSSPDRLIVQSYGSNVYESKFTWCSSVPGLDLYYMSDFTHVLFSFIVIFIGANLVLRALINFPVILEKLVNSGRFEYSKELFEEKIKNAQKCAQNRRIKLAFLIISTIIPCTFFYYTLDQEFTKWWGHYSYGPAGAFFCLATVGMLYYGCIGIHFLFNGLTIISFLFKHPINLLPFHPDGCNGLRGFWNYMILILLISIIIVFAIWITFNRGYLGIEEIPFTWLGALFGVIMIPTMLGMPLYMCVTQFRDAKLRILTIYEKHFQLSLEKLEVYKKKESLDTNVYKEIQEIRGTQKAIKEIYGSNIYPFNIKIVGIFTILNLFQTIHSILLKI